MNLNRPRASWIRSMATETAYLLMPVTVRGDRGAEQTVYRPRRNTSGAILTFAARTRSPKAVWSAELGALVTAFDASLELEWAAEEHYKNGDAVAMNPGTAQEKIYAIVGDTNPGTAIKFVLQARTASGLTYEI